MLIIQQATGGTEYQVLNAPKSCEDTVRSLLPRRGSDLAAMLILDLQPPELWEINFYSVDKESTCNTGDSGSIPGLGRSSQEGIGCPLQYSWASLVPQLGKNPPAMQETWVWSLGWEDPLQKGKGPHSSSLAWRTPGLYSLWVAKSRTRLSDFHFHINRIFSWEYEQFDKYS